MVERSDEEFGDVLRNAWGVATTLFLQYLERSAASPPSHPFLAACTPTKFLLQPAVSAKLIDAPRLAVLPTHRANKLLIESKHCLALNAAGQKPNQSSLDRFF